MTKGQRIGALALAVLVAVVAFVVLRPSGEDSNTADRRATSGTTSSTGDAKQAEQPQAEPAPAYSKIALRDGELVGAPEEISLDQGDTARIEVASDKAAEIHIHGYDEYLNVEPGKPEKTRFKTNLEGIFEIENHDTAEQLAELRVNP